ncbi:MAG: hypothetical protein ACI8UD_003424, partial [Planctomycetota bacterium]
RRLWFEPGTVRQYQYASTQNLWVELGLRAVADAWMDSAPERR